MKAFVISNVLGVFAYDERGVLLGKELFPDDPAEVAHKLIMSERGLIEEEERLISRLEGYLVFLEKPRRGEGYSILNPNPGGEQVRGHLQELLGELGVEEEEYRRRLHAVAIAKAMKELRKAFSKRDRRIIQAINCLEDLDEALNLLMERVREWHALSVPEYEELSAERETLLKKALSAEDEGLQGFAEEVNALLKYRRKLEDGIGREMSEVAPNLTTLAGPLLGAKLITLAKGLDSLAKMPASRIQILGAGRAFFKGKKRPPKHGVIFQHPLVRGSPREHRGRMARSLAAKIAIAARVDAYSGKPVAEELRRSLESRSENIR
jgi:nucleolar protein 56